MRNNATHVTSLRSNQHKNSFLAHMKSQAEVRVGFVLTALIIVIAVCAPMIAPNDPFLVNIGAKLQRPGALYWLGTDNLGRCIASRLIWGARMSLSYSASVLTLMLLISIPVGLAAGYAGGKLDAFITRIIDICLALPSFLLALAIVGTLGPGIQNLIIAMSSVWWASYARIIRGLTLQIKAQDFIIAARAAGCTHIQMIWRHILRNIIPSIIVIATLEIGHIILAIATYSFIGLGAQAPTPEWGVMLSDSKEFIQTQPQLMIYPGLAIIITVIAFNLLGEGMQNALKKRN